MTQAGECVRDTLKVREEIGRGKKMKEILCDKGSDWNELYEIWLEEYKKLYIFRFAFKNSKTKFFT